MKFKAVVEYEYPTEHKPPVKAEIVLHGDRVITDNIKWIEQEPVIRHNGVKDELNHVKDELESTTKNDLGVDCISRQAVLDLINADWKYENLEIEINNLPSVTPQEPKTGHWIKGYTFPDGAYWKCDNCNELIKVKIPMRYCNNCGAKMVEPQESGVEDGNDK